MKEMKKGATNYRKQKNMPITIKVVIKIMRIILTKMNKKKMMFLVMDQLILKLKF